MNVLYSEKKKYCDHRTMDSNPWIQKFKPVETG
jgi:hypothetical protein